MKSRSVSIDLLNVSSGKAAELLPLEEGIALGGTAVAGTTLGTKSHFELLTEFRYVNNEALRAARARGDVPFEGYPRGKRKLIELCRYLSVCDHQGFEIEAAHAACFPDFA